MESRLGLLERELSDRRDRYNTAFALARRARPRLEGELFTQHLKELMAPVIAALPSSTTLETARPLIESLYDLTLDLTGGDLFRRSEAVTRVWSDLFPSAAAVLLSAPRKLPAALTNAVYNLGEEETANPAAWIAMMGRHLPQCESSDQWLEVGKVASWLCGLAHYRESAIAAGKALPRPLRASLCSNWEAVVGDPWHPMRKGDARPEIVHRVGGFAGFGGCFRQPPWVSYAGNGRFVVEDGTETWLLSADAFGATLKVGDDPDIDVPARYDVSAQDNGTVRWGDFTTRFEELAPVRSSAASPHLLAVTSSLSHHVFLLLGPPGAPG